MASILNIRDARKLINPGSVVTLLCWLKDGSIRRYDKVIVTSAHRKPVDTISVMMQESRQVRTIRVKLIFQINDIEICL